VLGLNIALPPTPEKVVRGLGTVGAQLRRVSSRESVGRRSLVIWDDLRPDHNVPAEVRDGWIGCFLGHLLPLRVTPSPRNRGIIGI
jgi:hypothetical protein